MSRSLSPGTAGPSFGSATSSIHVAALETGLSAQVLRAWERRYGFPAPERRPGNERRMYSAADIAKLRLIKRALDRGYRVGDVVQKSSDELEALAQTGGRPDLPVSTAPSAGVPVDLEPMIALLATERMDDFDRELRRARASRDVKQFIVGFAHPLVVEIGLAWRDARLSVRHEHLATDSLTTLMRQMLAELQPMGTGPHILLGALPGEIYSLPLLFVSLYLAASGAVVRVLGNQTPCDEFVAAAKAMRVDVVGVSISRELDAQLAKRSVKRIRASLPRAVSLWIGGTGAAALESSQVQVIQSWSRVDEALAASRRSRPR